MSYVFGATLCGYRFEMEGAFGDTHPSPAGWMSLFPRIMPASRRSALSFDTLSGYLAECSGRSCLLTFDRIEEILGESLPPDASRREWWTNEQGAAGRMAAGWNVDLVRLDARQVRFVRNVD